MALGLEILMRVSWGKKVVMGGGKSIFIANLLWALHPHTSVSEFSQWPGDVLVVITVMPIIIFISIRCWV